MVEWWYFRAITLTEGDSRARETQNRSTLSYYYCYHKYSEHSLAVIAKTVTKPFGIESLSGHHTGAEKYSITSSL